MAWGGSRRGAGRPRNPIKRIGRTFRLSDEEFLSLKPLIMAIKANNDKRYRQQYSRHCHSIYNLIHFKSILQ
ncbi:MAG: hypothetical protein E7E89_09695 [Veillonella sp.]|nr:hypothetical protein [Veillonella sp.]